VRKHIIADLSENYVERYVLLSGYTSESVKQDYGYDMIINFFSTTGKIEDEFVKAQLKASDKINVLSDGNTISFPVSIIDLDAWINFPNPVILILYNAKENEAYWLYVQVEYQKGAFKIENDLTVNLHFKKDKKIKEETIFKFIVCENDFKTDWRLVKA
jgi:hypothetical protein